MNTNMIWYERPAERWKEAIPMGNGRMGAMIYGTVSEERLSLNQETIWDNPVDDYHNPKAQGSLPKLRQLLFEGKLAEAEELARECFISKPNHFGSYQPCADLLIMESDATQSGAPVLPKYYHYDDYRRQLDMANGIVSVTFKKNGLNCIREYFASHVDNVMVIRYSSPDGEPLDYELIYQKDALNVGSCTVEPSMLYYEDQLCNNGVRYTAALKVVAENDGAVVENSKILSDFGYMKPQMNILNATSFVIYLAITTDYNHADQNQCFQWIEDAAKKGYDAVKADHIKDYSAQYSKFSLELGDGSMDDISLLCWLDRVRKCDVSPEFSAMYMNYARYLLISSSREGTLPSTMQGIWNDRKDQAWESDFHININTQMNYWTAEGWGLANCEEPMVTLMEMLVEPGKVVAQNMYGAGGWTAHHCTNIFGYVEPNSNVVGMWPMGAAWCCRHLYEMWQHTRDYEQMRHRFWPLVHGAIEFIIDFLIEAPEGTCCAGKLVTNPSVSPENTYRLPNGEASMLTFGCTMDIQIIRDLFENAQEMIEEIQKHENEFAKDFAKEMKAILDRLPEMKVGKHGNLLEWIDDYDEVEPGHRHISHMYGVYPGRSVSLSKTPELAKAAKRAIERKYEVGYDGHGWSMGWQACVWARLGEGDFAHNVLVEDYRRNLLPNLMTNSYNVAQVGDMYGIPATIMELLVQSHEKQILLLPCLPSAWSEGRVKGFHTRGKHTVDMEWKNGILTSATIYHFTDSEKMPIIVKNPEKYEIGEDNDKTTITLK